MANIPQPPRSPLDPTRPESTAIWRRWFEDITKAIRDVFSEGTSNANMFSWGTVNKSGSDVADIEIRNHNDLQNIKGDAEGYHLSAADALAAEDLSDTLASTGNVSAGLVVYVDSTDNGDGSLTLPAIQVNLFDNAIFTGKPKTYNVSGGTTGIGSIPALTDNTVNYIIIKYNGGAPVYDVITDVSIINLSNNTPYITVYRDGTVLHQIGWDAPASGLADKLFLRFAKTRRFEREEGLVLSESATRVVNIASGIVWNGAHRQTLDAFASNVDSWHFWKHVGGVWTVDHTTTQYNNTQYDDGTDLQTLITNRYTINWIYRGQEQTKHAFYVLGNQNYVRFEDAQTAPAPTDLPNIILKHAILVGRIIVLKNASTASAIESAFSTVFISAPVTNHASLDNLDYASSGHTGFQASLGYTPVNNAGDTMTGSLTAPNYISTVATGTQPYACTSTTVNTNLNADLLDSQHGAYYLDRANHTGTDDHGALTGLADDDHTQYALLAGRSGGQTAYGGSAASENLTLGSTAHATKGKILFGTSAYDESKQSLLIGTNTYTFGASNNPVMVTHSSIAPGGGLSALYNRPDSTKQLFVGFLRGGDPLNQDFFIGSPATTTNQFCVGTGTGASISATMCAHKTTGFSFGDYGAIVTLTPPAWLSIIIPSASIKGQIIRAAASQTANLTEWQNSSAAVLSSVSAAGVFTAPNYISTVATGTQPYACTSTTLNTNHNSDLLDSQHGTYYLDRANHTGIVTNYNGIATEGYGHPAIVDLVALTAQTADITSTNFTNAGTAGLYRINYYLETTTADAAAGAVTLTVSFTDGAGATSVASSALTLTAVGRTSGVFFVRLASGSVAYSTTHSGSYGTAAYALHAICERVN